MSSGALQARFGVRFEWGPIGAKQLAVARGALVVVDVLSFATAVGVAVEAGIRVYPSPWRHEAAASYAEELDAALAVGRHAASAGSPYSLSPAALREAPFTPRLVLPSPNGSAIAAAAGDAVVLAASLRNFTATAGWLCGNGFGTPQRPASVIAAGERWPDDSLRAAVEDMLGAGAVISVLSRLGGGSLSPEAEAARACFEGTTDIAAAIATCASGVELTEAGFSDDVAIASELDKSDMAAVLDDSAFMAQRR
ncbi:MAG: 2-phosphosulfolactate phosphatase [Actinobacteria bacterium]|nr:2-phosphosulfolactate phosphatase [Actinomycetota bacterium]